MPADEWRGVLPERLTATYGLYGHSPGLREALQRSSGLRFTGDQRSSLPRLADAVTTMVFSVADSKSTPRFKRPS